MWRARDLLLQRPVAVKLLRPEYADHPETLERFRAEARHAGAVTHPCIAQVYDYRDGEPDTSPYLVMELVDGPSLAEVLYAGTIGAVRTMDIIAQAAAGLAAAHRTGLVHRDIKPANILLNPDGLVKITDFGLAYAAGSARITAPQMVMGTAHYMAPERCTGEPDGPASDLYSLGVVLYECLAEKPPFDGTSAEVMAAHVGRSLPPVPPCVPPAIRELLARLTAKDPAMRLANATELATVAGQLSAALSAAPAVSPAERALIAEPAMMAELANSPVPAAAGATPTRTDARPARGWRRRVLAITTVAAVLAAFAVWLAASALRVTALPGQSAPGPTISQTKPPVATTPHGTRRGVNPSNSAAGGSGQPARRTAAPSPSPSPDRNPGHSTRAGQDVRQAHGNGKSTTSKPTATSSPSPSSTSSGGSGVGVGLQSPLPGITITLGL